jgi:hypothetical protein
MRGTVLSCRCKGVALVQARGSELARVLLSWRSEQSADAAQCCQSGKTLSVSSAGTESALAKLPSAAVTIAAERRMGQFVDVANRIHFS